MSPSKYQEQRLDPRWQKKRLEIMQRDGFACLHCGDEQTTLNVHHSYYIKSRMPWEYPNFSLLTLCKNCHKRMHEREGGDWTHSWEYLLDVIGVAAPSEIDVFFARMDMARCNNQIPEKELTKLAWGMVKAAENWKAEQ